MDWYWIVAAVAGGLALYLALAVTIGRALGRAGRALEREEAPARTREDPSRGRKRGAA